MTIGTVGDRRVAFIPRHGTDHEFPPHLVPYRANVWAMKELGVTRLFGPSAAGSLQPRHHHRRPSWCRTRRSTSRKSRPYTFFDGPVTTHVSFADPYCPELRQALVSSAGTLGIEHRDGGTMVVIEGPRFSTRAESKMFAQVGGDVIGMTQFPEVTLAREAELCFANVALVTDYDVGVDGIAPVSHHEVLKVFGENIEALRNLLFSTIPTVPGERGCTCGQALVGESLMSRQLVRVELSFVTEDDPGTARRPDPRGHVLDRGARCARRVPHPHDVAGRDQERAPAFGRLMCASSR